VHRRSPELPRSVGGFEIPIGSRLKTNCPEQRLARFRKERAESRARVTEWNDAAAA
jgi:hypothetical protein